MAYRFTKTEKWKDKWYVELPVTEKIVWQYLCDNCDNAGFFEPNPRIDSYTIGITKEQFEKAIKGLIRGLIFSHDNEKIFIKKFLIHQNNYPLNTANNAHKQIVNIINLNTNKFNYDFTYLGANEGLISPLSNSNSKGNGIVEVKVGAKKFELSEMDIGKTIEYLDITQQKKYNEKQIKDLWLAFLIQYEDKFYAKNNDRVKHFRDWLKTQNKNYGKTANREPAKEPDIADYNM